MSHFLFEENLLSGGLFSSFSPSLLHCISDTLSAFGCQLTLALPSSGRNVRASLRASTAGAGGLRCVREQRTCLLQLKNLRVDLGDDSRNFH